MCWFFLEIHLYFMMDHESSKLLQGDHYTKCFRKGSEPLMFAINKALFGQFAACLPL